MSMIITDQLMKIPDSVYQKIRISIKINVQLKSVNMKSMSMYSTPCLAGVPLAWITAAMRHDMESIRHCSGFMRARVALIVVFSSSELLGVACCIFFTIAHRLSTKLRSDEFAGQSRTRIPWSLNQ
uniref:Uncharacterized protein n=1 Tax=Nothobranchius pienaari TaxID=704102 RepID=A0A1A8LRK9_9TELE